LQNENDKIVSSILD